jgi:hypothetical protein
MSRHAALDFGVVRSGTRWLTVGEQLSASQEAAARKFAEMLLRVRRQLAILKKWSSAVEDLPARRADERSELRLGLIDILEALIYFWRDCVHFFRSFPPGEHHPNSSRRLFRPLLG